MAERFAPADETVRRLDADQHQLDDRPLRRPARRRPAIDRRNAEMECLGPNDGVGGGRHPSTIMAAIRSATIMVGKLVLAQGMTGMIEASTTRSPSTP